jgi:hypothetical protein
MGVYVLHHIHILDTEIDQEEVKLIGIYSTFQSAKEAVERLKTQPGFRDTPEGFHIESYEIDKDHWTRGYVRECDDE